MNDKDFANSVSQDKLSRCLSAFARLCAESPGKASKLEYPHIKSKSRIGEQCECGFGGSWDIYNVFDE